MNEVAQQHAFITMIVVIVQAVTSIIALITLVIKIDRRFSVIETEIRLMLQRCKGCPQTSDNPFK